MSMEREKDGSDVVLAVALLRPKSKRPVLKPNGGNGVEANLNDLAGRTLVASFLVNGPEEALAPQRLEFADEGGIMVVEINKERATNSMTHTIKLIPQAPHQPQ